MDEVDGDTLIWTCGPQSARITTNRYCGRARAEAGDMTTPPANVRSSHRRAHVASPPARAAGLVDETLPRGGVTVNCHSIARAALKACMLVNGQTSRANVKQAEWIG